MLDVFCLRQRGVCVGDTADGFMDSCGLDKLEQEIIHCENNSALLSPSLLHTVFKHLS